MPDFADQATDLQEAHLAASLARVDRAIPAGVAGECDDCGEFMARLVNGRCGFCRDRRRPPAERYPSPPASPSQTQPRPAPKPKEHVMANPPPSADRRQVSFPATGAVLEEIMRRAEGSSIAQATMSLLQEALNASGPVPTATPADLGGYDTDELLAELRERASGGSRIRDLEADLTEVNAQLAAARAAAAAAEARLARVGDVLSGAA